MTTGSFPENPLEHSTLRGALTWIDGAFRPGVELSVSGGRIEAIDTSARAPTHPGRAILPGFVNAHSHAFQRGLRGHAEVFTNPADDFWTWRDAMYAQVDTLDPDTAHAQSLQAFTEMRRAGITSVGEFHYVHHGAGQRDWVLDEAVLSAAADAGIRIVLLHGCYLAGGFGQPISPGQDRFDGGDLATQLAALDRVQDACRGPLQSVGVVIHSLRAVPIDIAAQVRAEAESRGLVVHLHLEEQPAEITACRDAHGCTPMGLVLARLDPGPDMTAVHCTHTDPAEMEVYGQRGGRVCLCPLTEANLGDGIADVAGILASGASICLGTDSNARVSMLEEMRLCEYGQRLQHGRRGICIDHDGRIDTVLLDMACRAGAESIGIDAGVIAVGAHADFALMDLEAPELRGCTAETLGPALITGAGNAVVAGTIIGGC